MNQLRNWFGILSLLKGSGDTLASDIRKDQDIQGRHHTSHAEKQLVAYFVSKHCFLSEEIGRTTAGVNVVRPHLDSLEYLS